MEFASPFGAWLKQRRVFLGMTRRELARRIDYSIETLHKVEGGGIKVSQHMAERLVDPLQVSDAQRDEFIAFATGIEPHHKPHNLPAPATSLVGREHELVIARKWLRNGDARLITFVGPPGVGKTRLALQVARDLRDRFEDGVWMVDLSALTNPDQVTAAIAGVVGAASSTGKLEELAQNLRNRHTLLLLDNFEQVVAAGPVVSALLAAAPRLHVLITSRVALNLAGEHLFDVSPLDELPAVELFVQRAKAVRPGFSLNNNAAVVNEICARLDRLPLAIELAASRIKIFDPPQLLSRLDSRLKLLTSSAQDLPSRHRTLRGAIAVSYSLLSDDEQIVFRRLGAFAGGFTLEAAEQVTGEGLRLQFIDVLQSLIDHSLVKAEVRERETRYAMLQTILEYARDELAASGEADSIARRHAECFAGLAERGGVRWAHDKTIIMPEIPNLRLALDTACRLGDKTLQLRLLAIHPRSDIELYAIRDTAWLDELFDARDPETPALRQLYGRALLGASIIGVGQHARDREPALQERGIRLLEDAGDFSYLVDALDCMIARAWSTGDFARTAAYAERVVGMRQVIADDPYAIAIAQAYLAGVWRDCGKYDLAMQMFEESIKFSRAVGNVRVEGLSINGMGDLEYDRGNLSEACTYYESALQLWRNETAWFKVLPLRGLGHIAMVNGDLALAEDQLGRVRDMAIHEDSAGICSFILHYYAWLKHLQGDEPAADFNLIQAIHAQRKVMLRLNLVESLECAAWMAADRCQPALSAQLLGACAALRQAMGTPQPAGDRAFHERAVATARAGLDAAAFEAAWVNGAAMSLDESVNFGLAILETGTARATAS